MGTKTGKLRETLMAAIEAVKAGDLDPSRATAIAKLAGQINLSMEVEFNARLQLLKNGGAPSVGALPLGDETMVIEQVVEPAGDLPDEPLAIGPTTEESRRAAWIASTGIGA